MRISFSQAHVFVFGLRAPWLSPRCYGAVTLPLFAAQRPPNEKPRRVPKTIWNFEGGVFLETDGNLADDVCFRLAAA